jgi:hypothetical protein
MLLGVEHCDYQECGNKRVYTFTNASVATEYPHYPVKSRFRFYDVRGYRICKPTVKTAMKQAIERYKARHGREWS